MSNKNKKDICLKYDENKIAEYIDDNMLKEEKIEFENHLEECSFCIETLTGFQNDAIIFDKISSSSFKLKKPGISFRMDLNGLKDIIADLIMKPEFEMMPVMRSNESERVKSIRIKSLVNGFPAEIKINTQSGNLFSIVIISRINIKMNIELLRDGKVIVKKSGIKKIEFDDLNKGIYVIKSGKKTILEINTK